MTLNTELESPEHGVPPVRCVGRAHVDVLQALKEDVVDATWGRDYPAALVDAWKERFTSPRYFLDRLVPSPERPLTKFFVAGPLDAPFGMVALKMRDGRAYIGDLYVRTPGRGVGRQLLEHAEAEAGALGLEVVVADVFEGNRAAYQLLVSDGFGEADEYVESSLGIRVLRLTRALRTSFRMRASRMVPDRGCRAPHAT